MKSVILLSSLCGFIVVISAVNSANASELQAKKLKVEVYYETLCPDSIEFIHHQLYDAMTKDGLMQYTDLNFIPYGKVKTRTNPTTNNIELNCQHGAAECEINSMHACVVEHNTQQEQLEMINCMLKFKPINTCASITKTDVSAAIKCKKARATNDILKKYGMQTDTISIKFVPSVGIDGLFNPSDQDDLLYDFSKTFCRKYQEKFGISLKNC